MNLCGAAYGLVSIDKADCIYDFRFISLLQKDPPQLLDNFNFVLQSRFEMDADWAAQRLGEIRTLMERSSLYRRALAPIATLTGMIGMAAGVIGWTLPVKTSSGFCLYWMVTGMLSLLVSLLMIRRQAWKDKERFWSPPTRRFIQAICPALFAGACLGLIGTVYPGISKSFLWNLPALWMMFYGCALFSAGFFMPRGIKLFGSIYVLCGCISMFHFTTEALNQTLPRIVHAHIVMGSSFGILHFFYGVYLHLTDHP